jgi:hypothetical protein
MLSSAGGPHGASRQGKLPLPRWTLAAECDRAIDESGTVHESTPEPQSRRPMDSGKRSIIELFRVQLIAVSAFHRGRWL